MRLKKQRAFLDRLKKDFKRKLKRIAWENLNNKRWRGHIRKVSFRQRAMRGSKEDFREQVLIKVLEIA